MHIAIYPGSFDPVTNGHLDIIARAASLTDRLIIGIARDGAKQPLFSVDERVAMLAAELAAQKLPVNGNIHIEAFSGLLMHYAEAQNAKMIVRGLRAMTDFDYEFQMTGMNRRLNPAIETVFLMASETNQFISSRMVKEVARLGGDVSGFVPPKVARALKAKISTC